MALSVNIPPWKLFGWFRRLQLWATGDWQLHHDNVPTHASHLMQRFWWNIKSPRWLSSPNSPNLAPCNSWLFLKLKSSLKGKTFQTVDEIQKNRTGQPMVIGRTVWGPKAPTLEGTEASLSYVRCSLSLVSSLVNVSIFHITGWIVLDRPHISWQLSSNFSHGTCMETVP